jgi:peptidyl-tRNA hydrolase, PTH1 family
MRFIIGLGNPGKKYVHTRHNAGYMAVDALSDKLGLKWKTDKRFKAEICENEGLVMVKPQTFMNLSGESVRAILGYYKIESPQETLTVIHDDLDIEFGKYKISTDSRSAGHNGVQSIIDNLKTKSFTRVRIGIKTDLREKIPAEKFVLDRFSKEEQLILNKVIGEITAKLLNG